MSEAPAAAPAAAPAGKKWGGPWEADYKKEEMFSDSLEEFAHSRNVVQELVDEYRASERPDYISWGLDK